ncbi:MAG: LLM class flavin-dependent oxidoreductase, partial [Deltaproteobacteria bacterium]|nr:LLM class flavin-dependent oxidoreductase [Deltaproteobacteria bacterium]
ISFGPPVPETVSYLLSQVRAGARNAGRENDRFPCVWMTGVCVLHPGETLESPRVVNNIGWWVLAVLKILALVTALDLEKVPPGLRPVFKAYADHLAAIPKDELHLAVSEGLYTLTLPEGERRFVTPEAIRAMTLIGTRDEVIAQIKALEQAGVTQIAVATPFDGFRETASEISHELIGSV